jgi:hypothetical protein
MLELNPTKNNEKIKLCLEEAVRDGYKNGKWHIESNKFFYAFSHEKPVLKLYLADEYHHDLKYFPENDRVLIINKHPNNRYFERKGFLHEPGFHLDYKRLTKIKIFFGGRGCYANGIAESIGMQIRAMHILKHTLNKSETAKKILSEEKLYLNKQVFSLYRMSRALA